jgi:2-polyprenyl-3-methyl-5-hydroxy-6-metoxy-1,4-benzoquinol methylase
MADPREAGSKHAKYRTANPISRRLVAGFRRAVGQLVAPLHVGSVLDVGCGEGLVLMSLQEHLGHARCAAIDLDPREAEDAARNLPWCDVHVGSVYALPFADASFELVMCCEVLEHVDDPEQALKELVRVTSKHVLLSVPREPIWRGMNMLRGSYWGDWGNTPGHLNHWSAPSFERFVTSRLHVRRRRMPLPWTVLLAEKC